MTLPPFQTFLDRHADELLRLLVAMVGPSDAEDCFQETCLAALQAYPKLPGDANVRAWAFTIARNKAIDRTRARGRWAASVANVPDAPASGPDGGASDGASAWSPLAVLPEKQRAAVFLRVAAELSHREVAEVLGCSEDAARRSAHEGLKRLKEELT